jgi:hypothetical protein
LYRRIRVAEFYDSSPGFRDHAVCPARRICTIDDVVRDQEYSLAVALDSLLQRLSIAVGALQFAEGAAHGFDREP